MNRVRTEASVYLFLASLKFMGLAFRMSPKLRRQIQNPALGYDMKARYQFATRDNTVFVWVSIAGGKMRAGFGKIENPDVTIYYKDKETLAKIFSKSPEESLEYLLTNEMSYTGNISYLTRFSFLGTLLRGMKIKDDPGPDTRAAFPERDMDKARPRHQNEILDRKVDRVEFLSDPFLGRFSLNDFPRLKKLRNRRFSLRPAICSERARLVTEFHRQSGFEIGQDGKPFDPELRQAMAVNHILARKKPVIVKDHLMPGSTTAKEVGVPVYPELIGTLIWPELSTISGRELNPNDISKRDADILNFEVFPYWTDRNVREHCRKKHGNPLSQRLEERFVLYFMMKNNAISHTVPDFAGVVGEGLAARQKAAREKEKAAETREAKNFYRALGISIDGVLAYAKNLSLEADRQAQAISAESAEEKARKRELSEMARILRRVPARPAATLYEALVSLWVSFVCLHAENADSALSIGRLDRILQPYFAADMAKAKTDRKREEIVRRAVELVGSLFLKLNDHDPLVPGVGNKLFGGSSSDDTVTVGGVTPEGENAVCDMTYIILKAAEMLGFQDPNMNARFHPGINSPEYLRRLVEVNVNMGASPIIHNDMKMIEALTNQGIPLEDARDWAATGCVEPTIAGRHYGHTNCMLLNMVAPLEMALNNGVHPVMGEKVGPETGDFATAFPTFESFYAAYKAQLKYLADLSVEINDLLGLAHKEIHPTPLLSAMFTGPLDKGRDLIAGGAVYNTSGVALVSITDVIDSLAVIKDLVYDRKLVTPERLLAALATDFFADPELFAQIRKVPKFGHDDPETNALARDIISFCYDVYQAHESYRGGKYLPGYWSISYHVGFGMLSGALPSGRKKGAAFTPGLTPAPGDTDKLLPNLRSVAALDHRKMPNNIAFNVKLVPQPGEPHTKTLDNFTSYLNAYFSLGGMQWQMNVISTETLKAAMENPDEFRWLVVRISGYNAYFTKLNRNMQIELIERTEYRG
ncbi:MAG: pyruvate formate lyase family protein [Thermodesulfobacteriota bacterium]